MDFIWDLLQQWQLYDARSRADQAESKLRWTAAQTDRQQESIRDLERQVDRLTLVVTALCEHAVASGSITAERLQALVDEIDLRDGDRDGKMGQQPLRCPSCQHVSNPNRTTCLYCGAELQAPTPTE